jgi:hypothetical protein
MPLKQWIRTSDLSRDECELYFGSLVIIILAMAFVSLQWKPTYRLTSSRVNLNSSIVKSEGSVAGRILRTEGTVGGFCRNLLYPENSMLHKFFAVTAWTAFAAIVFVTVSPIEMRPSISSDPNIERFAAFAILGLLFGLAYPRRLVADAFFVVLAAATLETFQLITPDRHGHIEDGFVKAAGGAFGVALALIIAIMVTRRKAP